MQQTEKARGLAGAAAHLCSAYDELLAAGYERWSVELRMLMEIIDAEIDWLRTDETSPTHLR